MCGITGFIDLKKEIFCEDHKIILKRMTSSLEHRGPNNLDIYINNEMHIGMGHTRLAILDTSKKGNQPMKSECGRYVIVLNGEIYNFKEITKKIIFFEKNYQPKSKSDTEILLKAISIWGLEKTIEICNGMFAFGLLDIKLRKFFLVRDRMGEKPLYYGIKGNAFLFSSELKALKNHPSWESTIDRHSLSQFVSLGYIPAPNSIYKNINKLLPSHFLEVNLDTRIEDLKDLKLKKYWDLKKIASNGITKNLEKDEDFFINKTKDLIEKSVKQCLTSDVPLGAFLSGGTDSSTIVSVAQSFSSKPLKTFTIGSENKEHDESKQAKELSNYLGTEHTDLCLSELDLYKSVDKLSLLFDEPFADSSQIPTFLVSELAVKNVSVSLSGDAGDELFCGYKRYLLANNIWSKIKYIPNSNRLNFGNFIKNLNTDNLNAFNFLIKNLVNKYGSETTTGQKINKLGAAIAQSSREDLYKFLLNQTNNEQIINSAKSEEKDIFNSSPWLNLFNYFDEMMYFDQITYLPDDILVKLDRASMGVSLESRVPFLNHELVEWAWQIPLDLKFKKGKNKWILKKVLNSYVPDKFINRPKKGFSIPIGDWLRGPLKEWAEDLLSTDKLKKEGFFNADLISLRWEEHYSGKRNWGTFLWNILIFEVWLKDNQT